jgi:hypothetical protein
MEKMMDTFKFPDSERALEGFKRFEIGYTNSSEPLSDIYPAREQDYDNLLQEYLGFSQFIQSLFIGKDGYIIDTGNFETVNYELMYRIAEKIKAHPRLWKMFFQVA